MWGEALIRGMPMVDGIQVAFVESIHATIEIPSLTGERPVNQRWRDEGTDSTYRAE